MNYSSSQPHSSQIVGEVPAASAPHGSPILIVPYMWIGDFVRCHSVVKVLRARWPDRPVDLLTNTLCA
ncbi:MAG TPA: lipopolysaccharide heptosyltransferase II, partial [Aestuariivirgaceae bacterium]|nr:lipopolysaccharide heptosyltransferase II [Aestuariivirgaceae bacterium]